VCPGPDDIVVVNSDEMLLEDAQAEGRACAYCGSSGEWYASLIPLRPSLRAVARWASPPPSSASTLSSLLATLPSRCNPPCPTALLAYEQGFRP
jgi:hypothetical protein